MWEFFGETHHASFNDWVSTSVGGIALGEVLHRFSSLILDNTATGSNRRWRELGGFTLNPLRGFNRWLTGKTTRVYGNPTDRIPNSLHTRLDFGMRTVGEERLWEADTTRGYARLEIEYGDPFQGDVNAPFANFQFSAQVNISDVSLIGHAHAHGWLLGDRVGRGPNAEHYLGAYHVYEYINSGVARYGGQSLGPGLQSLFQLSPRWTLRTSAHLNATILGAFRSHYPNFSGRTYDYGPGASYWLRGGLERDGWRLLDLEFAGAWIHAINGTKADHLISSSRVRVSYPVRQFVGFGLDYLLVVSRSNYQIYPNVDTRAPQMRAFVLWFL
jgi:hypothetical protein